MAFTYTEVATGTVDGDPAVSSVDTGSFTTKRGALYIIAFSEFDVGLNGFGVSASSVTSDGFVAPAVAVDNIDWSGLVANQAVTVGGLYPVSLQLFVARGNGGTDTVTVACDDAPDLGTGYHNVRVWEIYGTQGVPMGVRQHKTAYSASTSTATVTLTSAVLPDSECFYCGIWNDSADAATAGSGWTEKSDTAWTNSQVRWYAQAEPTPSGAQAGAVSAINSREAAVAIFEVRELKTGWGVTI